MNYLKISNYHPAPNTDHPSNVSSYDSYSVRAIGK